MWTSSFLFFFLSADHLTSTSPRKFFCRLNLSRKVVYSCLPTEKGDGREREVGKDCGEKGSMEGGKFLCSQGQWRPDTEVTGAGGGRADFGRWGTLYPCPPFQKPFTSPLHPPPPQTPHLQLRHGISQRVFSFRTWIRVFEFRPVTKCIC